MRNSSAVGRQRGPGRKARLLAISAFAVMAGLVFQVGTAMAAPVTYTFNHGKTDFGILRNVPILPAPSVVAGMPNANVNAVLSGDATSNGAGSTALSFAPGDVYFPLMSVENPFDPAQPIPVQITATGATTGTVTEATGETTMTMPVAITAIVGQNEMGPQTCTIAPVLFNLSSNPDNTPYPGTPFSDGLGVNGAVSAAWETLPAGVPANGANCDLLNSAITSSGGIWLSNGIAEPISPPPPPAGQPALNMNVQPKVRRARPGGRTAFVVAVRNRGNAVAAATRVCVRAPAQRFVAVRRCVRLGPLAAGQVKRARFVVRVKRGNRAARSGARLNFRYTANARQARAVRANSRIVVR